MVLIHHSVLFQQLLVVVTVEVIPDHPAQAVQVVDKLAAVAEQAQEHPDKVLQVVTPLVESMAQVVEAVRAQ
jgi:ABC-type nitrate/sulfonate/bicarbonate transport system substrate-binding protein